MLIIASNNSYWLHNCLCIEDTINYNLQEFLLAAQ